MERAEKAWGLGFRVEREGGVSWTSCKFLDSLTRIYFSVFHRCGGEHALWYYSTVVKPVGSGARVSAFRSWLNHIAAE